MKIVYDTKGIRQERIDEKNQFLLKLPLNHLDPYLDYDSWESELAVKMIVIGYRLDIQACWDDAKEWPFDSYGANRARNFIDVYQRGMSIAESSIAAGLLKSPDTPANWLAWAERKGYDVTHIKPQAPPEIPTTDATPAPVADSTSNAPVATPPPVATGDVAYAFDGLRGWNEKSWKDTLGSPPKWLEACMAIRGQRGVRENHWNPVLIGAALVHNGHAKQHSIRARFQTKPQLKDWLEAWKTYEADNFDTL